jgi:hypothetical protein
LWVWQEFNEDASDALLSGGVVFSLALPLTLVIVYFLLLTHGHQHQNALKWYKFLIIEEFIRVTGSTEGLTNLLSGRIERLQWCS